MLFLAVFCGSLAEYQLEHKIEADREFAYIQSMVEDLQKDTQNIRTARQQIKAQDLHFDTIFARYALLGKGYDRALRQGLEKVIGYREIFPVDRTRQQLLNAGGMRLIRNKAAADGIVGYNAKIKEHDKTLAVLDEAFTKFYDLSYQIQDLQLLEADRARLGEAGLALTGKNYLLQSDPAQLGYLHNRLKTYRLLRQVLIRRMDNLENSAIELMALLKKEYDLD